jgi:hypothetical protein
LIGWRVNGRNKFGWPRSCCYIENFDFFENNAFGVLVVTSDGSKRDRVRVNARGVQESNQSQQLQQQKKCSKKKEKIFSTGIKEKEKKACNLTEIKSNVILPKLQNAFFLGGRAGIKSSLVQLH